MELHYTALMLHARRHAECEQESSLQGVSPIPKDGICQLINQVVSSTCAAVAEFNGGVEAIVRHVFSIMGVTLGHP